MAGFLTRIAARIGASEGVLRPRTRVAVRAVRRLPSIRRSAAACGRAAARRPLSSARDEVDAPAVAKPRPDGSFASKDRRSGTSAVAPNSAASDLAPIRSRQPEPGSDLRRRGSLLAVHAGRPSPLPDRAGGRSGGRGNARCAGVAGCEQRDPAGRQGREPARDTCPSSPRRRTIEEIEARPVVVRRGTTDPRRLDPMRPEQRPMIEGI